MRRSILMVCLALAFSLLFGTAVMAAEPDVEAQIQAALTQYSEQLAKGTLTDEEKTEIMTRVEAQLREMLELGFRFSHASNLIRESLKGQNAAQIQTMLQLTQESYNGLCAGLSADMPLKNREKAMRQGLEQLTYAVKKCHQLMNAGADPDQVMAMYREALANGMGPKEAAKYVKREMKQKGADDDGEEDGDSGAEEGKNGKVGGNGGND